MGFEEFEPLILPWVPAKNDWELVSWTDWSAFLAIRETPKGLPAVSGGIHYFMVCIIDGDGLHNLMSHKYLIDSDGKRGRANFSGLTKEERTDYSRLMVEMNPTDADKVRLNEIRRKGEDEYLPPRQSLVSLIRRLPVPPRIDSAAE